MALEPYKKTEWNHRNQIYEQEDYTQIYKYLINKKQ